jgi:hypothetical protein
MRTLHVCLALLLSIGGDALALDRAAERGAEVYQRVCAMCHLPDPREDRPARAIGVDGGVLRALETIGAMRFVLGRLTTQEIVDVQAWLDTFAAGYIRDVRALNGNWFDPASAGQGLSLALSSDSGLSALFFGHRDDGGNLILVGATATRPRYGQTIEIPLSTVSGGRFTALDPQRIRYEDWGTLRLRFASCTAASAELLGRDGRQVLTLQPLTRIEELACE